MNDLNRQLLRVFQFQPADLRANRDGRLSRRQEAVLRASSAGMRLGMAIFAIVMLGSVAIVILAMGSTGAASALGGGAAASSRDMLIPLGVLGAVALVVILIGYLLSRGHMAAARSRRISVARGRAEVMSANSRNHTFKIAIGATVLRLAAEEQLLAFQPGIEYRVFYLAGPVPIILSAEVDTGELPGEAAPAEPETDEQIAQDSQVQVIRRGYLIVVLIGVLALAIPVLGILASSLTGALRGLVWLVLLVLAIGFALFAIWWLSPRRAQ